jgi:general secretion pathway protein C
MEVLLKRHFWVITLTGLALIAWLAAGSINAFVGMRLAVAGRSEDKPNISAASGESSVAKRLADGRLKPEDGAIIAGRSIFLNEEPKVEEPPASTDETDVDKAGGEGAPPPEPTYEPTTLPVKLLGTMVVSPSEFSSASVELDKKDQKVVGVGTEILDGKATILAIRRNYLVLKEADKLTIAPLYSKDPLAAGGAPGADGTPGQLGRPPMPDQTPKRGQEPKKTSAAEPQVEGVKKLSDTSYQLDRKHINDKLRDLASLGQQVRIVPNYKNGKYSGVRMIGMQDGSLFGEIGFTNGDILLAVNGEQLDSPNKALSLYEALKNKARLTVLIERGGVAKTLRYTVQ